MLYLQNSEITSSVQGGLGNGGDIDIDPEFVIMNRKFYLLTPRVKF
jgi:hypothetical protein